MKMFTAAIVRTSRSIHSVAINLITCLARKAPINLAITIFCWRRSPRPSPRPPGSLCSIAGGTA